jgi:hypothetical protein
VGLLELSLLVDDEEEEEEEEEDTAVDLANWYDQVV